MMAMEDEKITFLFGQVLQGLWRAMCVTPFKFNMEPENNGVQEESPFPKPDFQSSPVP